MLKYLEQSWRLYLKPQINLLARISQSLLFAVCDDFGCNHKDDLLLLIQKSLGIYYGGMWYAYSYYRARIVV